MKIDVVGSGKWLASAKSWNGFQVGSGQKL